MFPRLALLLLVLLFARSTASADWPQWRGPKRDGTTPDRITRWPPRKLWQFEAGYGVSSVIVAAGRAYVMGHRDGRDTVYCLDAALGHRAARGADAPESG